MIVQCDRCQTRFRLPDGAVGEKGAKARCSRCGNVFVVTKPSDTDTQATVPPPAGYSGLTAVSGAMPQVFSPSEEKTNTAFLTEGPPTTRTEVPSYLAASQSPPTPARPAPRPPPPSALGAFAPSSAGRVSPSDDSLPPPAPTAPETSKPEQMLDQFFDIPPPSSMPTTGATELPAFGGPAFGRTAEVSKFSRASYVSFPPPAGRDSLGPPAPPPEDDLGALPEAPGVGAAFDIPSWSVQDKATVRMEPDQLPDLDSLPEPPSEPFPGRALTDTAERDPFELQSALEHSAPSSPAPAARRPPQRAKTAGPTRRLDVGGLDFISAASKSIEPMPPEPRAMPAWAVELAAVVLAAVVAMPFILGIDDPSSPFQPIASLVMSAPGPIDPAAIATARAEGVRVQSLIGSERGVVVRGRVRNLGGSPLAEAEVVVHALEGERVVERRSLVLAAPLLPDEPSDFALVFPSAEIDYRRLRFRVEITPKKAASAAAGPSENP